MRLPENQRMDRPVSPEALSEQLYRHAAESENLSGSVIADDFELAVKAISGSRAQQNRPGSGRNAQDTDADAYVDGYSDQFLTPAGDADFINIVF